MDFQQFQYHSSPIVKDFHVFLDYLKNNKLKLTSTLFHLPKKDLYRMNQLLTHPEKGVNERNKQNLYPQLHLFYHLLFSSELAWIEKRSKSNILLHLNLEKVGYFQALNPTEQYFFLFKTLFQYCDFEKISTEERGGRIFFHQVDELFLLAIKLKEGEWTGLNHKTFGERSEIFYFLGPLILYLSYFGFWECKRDSETHARTFIKIKRLKPSPLGKAFSQIITTNAPAVQWNKYLFFSASSEMSFGFLLDVAPKNLEISLPKGNLEDRFRHLFPKDELGEVVVKSPEVYQEGAYTFKIWPVYHPKVWRKVQMTDKHTLEELHLMIQEVFDFDNDHLYSFFPDGDFRSKIAYHDPRGGMGLSAEEITIGELFLKEHQTLAYLFDYGDEWMFYLELEKIEAGKIKHRLPKLIDAKGKAPEQYPSWEEGW